MRFTHVETLDHAPAACTLSANVKIAVANDPLEGRWLKREAHIALTGPPKAPPALSADPRSLAASWARSHSPAAASAAAAPPRPSPVAPPPAPPAPARGRSWASPRRRWARSGRSRPRGAPRAPPRRPPARAGRSRSPGRSGSAAGETCHGQVSRLTDPESSEIEGNRMNVDFRQVPMW